MKYLYRITRPGREPYYVRSLVNRGNFEPGTEIWEETIYRGQTVDFRQIPIVCGWPVATVGATTEDMEEFARIMKMPIHPPTPAERRRQTLARLPIIGRLWRQGS